MITSASATSRSRGRCALSLRGAAQNPHPSIHALAQPPAPCIADCDTPFADCGLSPTHPQVKGGSKCDLFDYTCAAKEKEAKEALAAE